jgi:signal transduction histidine kinase
MGNGSRIRWAVAPRQGAIATTPSQSRGYWDMSADNGSLTAFLDGGGRMGALMRSRDWTTSPLGPPAAWPDTLKIAVATCLGSNFPMVIWWGPQLLMFYNDAWQPILGEGKHPGGLGRPGAESWPETWPIVGAQFENALKGVASWSEDLLLASDRRGFLEECYFTYSHSPLKDVLGRAVGVCSVVSETTSRVLSVRRLRVLHNLAAAILDATSGPDSLQSLCLRLVRLLWLDNPDVPFAALYVTQADEGARLYASSGIDDSLLPEALTLDAAADRWGIADVLRSRAPVTVDASSWPVQLPGGAWPERTSELVALPLSRSNRSRELCGVLVVGVNARLRLDEPYQEFLGLAAAQLGSAVNALQLLDQERRARADAERSARAKDEFLALLSHELRTPLNAVVGWTAILKHDLSDPVRAARAVEVIDRNARQQARLISDLLDVSHIASGSLRLDVQSVDLCAVIGAAVEAVTPAAIEKGVTLRTRLDAQLLSPRGDPARLQQVVWNLLVNAVKFTPSGGRVEIALLAAGPGVELRVTDTGEGIDPALMPHVFDGFRQADASASRAHGGLGLGLTIVKKLVELHGGRVEARSEGPGRGATFVVQLSCEAGQRPIAPVLATPATKLAEPPSLRNLSILLVDDDRDAIGMVRRFVEDRSGRVEAASTAAQALDILDREPFDMIVSDIAMPGGDGYSLIAEIRRRGLTIPAVALTAFARADDQARALAMGYQAHVAKPVDPAELLGTLVRLAGRN